MKPGLASFSRRAVSGWRAPHASTEAGHSLRRSTVTLRCPPPPHVGPCLMSQVVHETTQVYFSLWVHQTYEQPSTWRGSIIFTFFSLFCVLYIVQFTVLWHCPLMLPAWMLQRASELFAMAATAGPTDARTWLNWALLERRRDHYQPARK